VCPLKYHISFCRAIQQPRERGRGRNFKHPVTGLGFLIAVL